MTLEEYTKEIDRLSDILLDEKNVALWDENLKEINKFQYEYMPRFLEEYKSTIDCEAKQYIYDVFNRAVYRSQSGNAIVDIPTKEIADVVEDIVWEEIGDFLLDCYVYEDGDHYCLDVIFGGYYIPEWDGWDDM